MGKISLLFLLPLLVSCVVSSSSNTMQNADSTSIQNDSIADESFDLENVEEQNNGNDYANDFAIDTLATTISTRFTCTDTTFKHQEVAQGTFADYLQHLPLRPHGTRCHYWDGGEKMWPYTAAVVDMDIDNEDLQQCADAVMRLRGEYLFFSKQYDKLHFNFTNGFCCDFITWAEGGRIGIKGNKTWWRNGEAQRDYSYRNFRKWMKMIFYYAGTLSLSRELKPVNIEDVQIGDILIRGGSPGHAEIIVDVYKNEKKREVKLMLAQSYMPAQEIEIMYTSYEKSPYHIVSYDQDIIYTTSWSFSINEIMRFAE